MRSERHQPNVLASPCLTRSSVCDECFCWDIFFRKQLIPWEIEHCPFFAGAIASANYQSQKENELDISFVFFSNRAIFLKMVHKARGTSWQNQIPTSTNVNSDFHQIRFKLRDKCKPRSGSMALWHFLGV